MDILQGYESSDSNEEISNQSYEANSKEFDDVIENNQKKQTHPESEHRQENTDQKKTHLENVDFFSLSSASTQLDDEVSIQNSQESTFYMEPSKSKYLENQEMTRVSYNIESYECSNTSESVTCTEHAVNRNNLDLKHRDTSHVYNLWEKPNIKQQYTQKHSVSTEDLQPYVPNKKRKSVSEKEKNKDTGKKSIGRNMFTTPTLIAANIEKENSKLPRTKYVSFNDAHSAAVTRVKWNIARYSHLLLSASFDKSIKIWDCVDFNTCILSITSHTNGIKDAQWSKCGYQILSGGFDKTVKLHDVQTDTCLHSFPTSSSITCLQFHPTQPNLFLAGTYASSIYSFDINSGKVVNEYKGNFGEVLDVEFLSNGCEFVSASSFVGRDSANRTLMVWDFKTSAVVSNQLYHEKYTCPYLKGHPKENVFLAQSNANYIAIFSSRRPYKLNKFKRFESHKIEGYPIGFDLSPDGNIIASGSSDGCVYLYNYKTSKLIKNLSCYGDNDACIDVAYHPVLPGVIATCSWQGKLTIWQ